MHELYSIFVEVATDILYTCCCVNDVITILFEVCTDAAMILFMMIYVQYVDQRVQSACKIYGKMIHTCCNSAECWW